VLDLYTKPIPLDPDVDVELLARATPGFSGADLANLVNKAALYASVYIYVYTYIYLFIYIHTYIHIFIYIYVYLCI